MKAARLRRSTSRQAEPKTEQIFAVRRCFFYAFRRRNTSRSPDNPNASAP